MGRPRGSKNKTDFEDLDSDFKSTIENMAPEEINLKIAEVAKAEAENQKAKIDDGDLADKKEAVKLASEGYREATKMNKMRIAFAMRVLDDKGKA